MDSPDGLTPPAGRPQPLRDLFLGGGAVLLGHVLFPAMVFLTEAVVSQGTTGYWLGLGMVFGLVQLLWVVPLALWSGMSGRKRFLQGVLITAGLIFLANSACWGLVGLGALGHG